MSYDPLAPPGERESSFGRNLFIVLALHLAFLGGFWFAVKWSHKPAEQILWIDGGGIPGAPASPEIEPPPAVPPAPPEPVKPPEPEVKTPEQPSEFSTQKPTPTPKPKPTPTPKPAATPTPKPATPAPKKEVKTTPKPKAPLQIAKLATPKPTTAKPEHTREGATGSGEANTNARTGTGTATNAGTKGGPGAAGGVSQSMLAAYGDVVGSKFKAVGAPSKPVSVEGNNREFSAILHVKIARDGTVLATSLQTPCGNQLVDDWIRATIPDFKQVPPPPAELVRDGPFEASMQVIYEL